MPNDARTRLLDLLDKEAFDPVLKASPNEYKDDATKQKLKGLQDTTRSTQKSYHDYGSASKVREMFRDDLNSDAARKVHDQLRDLDLPTLPDIESEFERLAEELGVGR